MEAQSIVELVSVAASILVLSPLLAAYMTRVYTGKPHLLSFLCPLEARFYRLIGADPREGMDWKGYAKNLLLLSLTSTLLLFALLVGQGFMPLNPRRFPGLRWDMALNTAISFMTNTNWQSYSGESTLGYFAQMLGLTVQNFLSAAAGMAVSVAVTRGLSGGAGRATPGSPPAGHHLAEGPTGSDGPKLGNFWVDTTRSVIYVLLPLSLILALSLSGLGVIQNFSAYVPFKTIAGKASVLPMGPVASQVAIKQLGTNGGGFFGQNSSHPFENPTPLSNLLELLGLIVIPGAFPLLFGRLTGRRREGVTLFGVMFLLFALGAGLTIQTELSSGGLEGKELRFGVVDSALWAEMTTMTSSGSVNAMHDSLAPLAGLVPLVNMMLGEVVFGGVGSGLYGMLALVVVTVFIAGLMVGRSPEYLGRRVEAREVQLAMAAIILPNLAILVPSALSVLLEAGTAPIGNPGPHGLSEILYAFSSAAGNNGSAFAGLGTNTYYYNLVLGLCMLVGRFGVMVPLLALADGMAAKPTHAETASTFATSGLLFGGLLVGVVLIIAGLTHFPALSLGPILDHLVRTAP